jgi:hypothetical protein
MTKRTVSKKKSARKPSAKPAPKPPTLAECEAMNERTRQSLVTFTLSELAHAYGSNFSIGEEYTPYSFAREVIDDARRELQIVYEVLFADDPQNPLVDAVHNMNCRLELAGNALAKFWRAPAPQAEVAQ